jgi:preprotein translocase subunit SecY
VKCSQALFVRESNKSDYQSKPRQYSRHTCGIVVIVIVIVIIIIIIIIILQVSKIKLPCAYALRDDGIQGLQKASRSG